MGGDDEVKVLGRGGGGFVAEGAGASAAAAKQIAGIRWASVTSIHSWAGLALIV